MKLGPIIMTIITVLLCGCYSPRKKTGWYPVASDAETSISGKPLATVKDFERVVLITDTFMADGKSVCQTFIQGKLKPDKISDFADGTGKLIGRRLAFVFNDSVIMTPQINARIESGSFQITSPDTALLRSIYNSINNEIKKRNNYE